MLSWIGPEGLRVTFSQGFKLLVTKLLPLSQSQQILLTAPRVPVAGTCPGGLALWRSHTQGKEICLAPAPSTRRHVSRLPLSVFQAANKSGKVTEP